MTYVEMARVGKVNMKSCLYGLLMTNSPKHESIETNATPFNLMSTLKVAPTFSENNDLRHFYLGEILIYSFVLR